jgi:hypothetical protein
MTLQALGHWLESTALSRWIQSTHGAIADIQIVHILALATLFALALNLSLRIAGRGLAAEPVRSVAGRFVPAIWICLLVLLISGTLLIVAEPGRAIFNQVFYTKMVLVLLAVSFTLWLSSVARRQEGKPTRLHTTAAVLYMLIWISVIVAGRFIAYTV